jgi:hypothetical protein
MSIFPDAIQILDWYHAVDHLWQTAHSLFGEDNKKCAAWVNPLKELLWAGKVNDVIEKLFKDGFPKKILGKMAHNIPYMAKKRNQTHTSSGL